MLKRVLPQFGEAVARVLEEHGLSDRAAQYRTGIDRITMADMRNGYIPRVEQVEKFARGFGLDVNEWREMAGYERVESPSDTLLRGWDAICEEHPTLDIPFPLKAGGVKGLTQENAEDILTEIRRKIGLGMYPVKRDAAAVRD